ncbi:hypothetical protein V6N13_065292 [Hibiscus sabdariffa]
MNLQKKVEHGELSFIDKDVRNLFDRVKRMLEADDAKNFVEYMKSAKQENKMFQYAFIMDGDKRLEHLFWCQAQSFDWYKKHGDVVVFYTTYKVNVYDMPCGFFVGMDNHGKIILFECAILHNETTSTFKWSMKMSVPEEFEHNRTLMVAKFKLQDNGHIKASRTGKEVIDEDTLPEDEYILLSYALGGGD